MTKIFHLYVMVFFLFLSGCSSSDVTPDKLAKLYYHCKEQQTKSTVCLKHQNQFHQMNELLIHYSTAGNLGQDIINAQVMLVTIHNKLDNQGLSDENRNEIEQAVIKQRQKIIALQAMFLLVYS